jgi:DNA-binding CsgD family transcriptional regulator
MIDANIARPRGRPRSLTPDHEATVLDLRARGIPATRIAEIVGVHPRTINRFLRDRGATEKLDAAAIAAEYNAEGETYKRIADRHGTSISTVRRAVQTYGQPARRGRPGAGDGRRGRGRHRGWQGEDYPRDKLGQRGREAWTSWLAAMSDEERASIEAALMDLNTPLHDTLRDAQGSRSAHLVKRAYEAVHIGDPGDRDSVASEAGRAGPQGRVGPRGPRRGAHKPFNHAQ